MDHLDRVEDVGREDDLDHAADQAIRLREAVRRLPDPILHTLVDQVLYELGRMIAQGEG